MTVEKATKIAAGLLIAASLVFLIRSAILLARIIRMLHTKEDITLVNRKFVFNFWASLIALYLLGVLLLSLSYPFPVALIKAAVAHIVPACGGVWMIWAFGKHGNKKP